ncbi:hypothetical protein GW17_00033905 [Ensete ventricosum]|nr:hypothetical protein GW17_00033905 [Ensete ventricosum]
MSKALAFLPISIFFATELKAHPCCWFKWFVDAVSLWATGGGAAATDPCMAKEQGMWRSHMLLYWLLLCLCLLPLAQATDRLKTSVVCSSARRLLFPSTSQSMKLHPKNSTSTTTSKFQETEHEVPSGPNPVSNRCFSRSQHPTRSFKNSTAEIDYIRPARRPGFGPTKTSSVLGLEYYVEP